MFPQPDFGGLSHTESLGLDKRVAGFGRILAGFRSTAGTAEGIPLFSSVLHPALKSGTRGKSGCHTGHFCSWPDLAGFWPDSFQRPRSCRYTVARPCPLVRPHPRPPARRRDRNVTRAAQGRGGGQVRRPSETAKRDRRNPDLRPISVTRECCQGLASPSTPKNSSHTPSSAGPGVSADGARGGLRGGVKSIVSRWRPVRPWGRGAR